MSRSYGVLAAAILGVAGLAGVARVAADDVAEPAPPATTAAPTGATPDETSSEGVGGPDVEPMVDPDCALSVRLAPGDVDPQVACLEARLIAGGALTGVSPDETFDAPTEVAVRAFQAERGLVVDGVVGPETAMELGAWSGPDMPPPSGATCPTSGRSAVVDRFSQRAWLCERGEITAVVPITSAISQPDPGTYEVYAKDLNASSNLSGEYSTMTHFVAFSYGKYQGARIAFHSVPKDANGEYLQPLDSVGTKELHGDSSGCIRVLPDDALLIWRWLDIGDTVTVVT